jgi:hypothetical protein
MTRVFLLLILSLHTAQLVATEIPEVVKACLEKNTPKSTSAQAIELRARDRNGYEQVLQSNVYWKRFPDNRSRVLMHFDEQSAHPVQSGGQISPMKTMNDCTAS